MFGVWAPFKVTRGSVRNVGFVNRMNVYEG